MTDKERLEEIKIFEAMKETILKKEPDEDKQWLINRVQELEEQWSFSQKFYDKKYQRLAEENQRYKEVLEFYSNEINYQVFIQNGKSNIERDGGERARKELRGES